MITFPIVATHRNGNTKLFYNLEDFVSFCISEIVGEHFNQTCTYFDLKFQYENYKGYKDITRVVRLKTIEYVSNERIYEAELVVRDDLGRKLLKDFKPHNNVPLY